LASFYRIVLSSGNNQQNRQNEIHAHQHQYVYRLLLVRVNRDFLLPTSDRQDKINVITTFLKELSHDSKKFEEID